MKKSCLFLAIIAACTALITAPAYASIQEGATAAKGSDQPQLLFGDTGVFSEITNVLLLIIGAVSVIMIVIGGLRYVISGGDAKQVDAAKSTILYAIIGIIIAILAYAAVSFVTDKFTSTGSSNSINDTSSIGTSTR